MSDNNVTMVIAAEDVHMHNVSCITNLVPGKFCLHDQLDAPDMFSNTFVQSM